MNTPIDWTPAPYVKSFDVVGYTFCAETLCPGCTRETFETSTGLTARESTTEGYLTSVARYVGIDREDEASFDSGTFPKVIFADSVQDDEACDSCGGALL